VIGYEHTSIIPTLTLSQRERGFRRPLRQPTEKAGVRVHFTPLTIKYINTYHLNMTAIRPGGMSDGFLK